MRLDTTPNPYLAIKPGTGLGAYVRTTLFGYTGRVFKVSFGCSEDEDWQAMQSYDTSEETVGTARWLHILVHDGGSVTFPETLCEPIEPFGLKNRSTIFYFGEGER